MCALPKRIKVGGSYYKGYSLTVNAATGDYVLDMTLASDACAINGITIIPSEYGAGDTFKLEHLASDNTVLETLAETVYNVGASVAWQLDFSAIEKMLAGEKFRLTYTNAAGVAMTVYTLVERIK